MMGEVRLTDGDTREAACLIVFGTRRDYLQPFLQAANGWTSEQLLRVFAVAAETQPEATGEALHFICDLALNGLTVSVARQELLERLHGNLAALRTPHPADVVAGPDDADLGW